MSERHYTYRVEWSPDDAEYVGLVAEFPSLSWLEPDPVAAITGITNLVAEVVADMVANNEHVPEPLSERRYSGKIALRLSPDLHRRLTVEAAEQGVSLNAWISQRVAEPTRRVAWSTAAGALPPIPVELLASGLPARAPGQDSIGHVGLPPRVPVSAGSLWQLVTALARDGEFNDRLPAGVTPTSAQPFPDGTIVVYGEKNDDGRYPAYSVGNIDAVLEALRP